MRQQCDRLLARNPQNVTLLSLAGSAAYGQGRFAEAIDLLERALALRPASSALQSALQRAKDRFN